LKVEVVTKRIAFSFITPLPMCLKEKRVISNPSVCSASHYFVVIDVDGTFRPCSVCNPLDISFPKIESATTYQTVYDKLKPVIETYLTKDIPAECQRCKKTRRMQSRLPIILESTRHNNTF
jgi:radical SAM protein with 4Fe4S-binding SPASM domain